MFKITNGRGFQITFKNGWTASVQFGVGNYCDHHDDNLSTIGQEREAKVWSSQYAEVAAWPDSGELVPLREDGGTVRGWLSANDVLAFLQETANR